MATLSVCSFYPYAVRAISAVYGMELPDVYRAWRMLDEEFRVQYLNQPLIRQVMVELAEWDEQNIFAGKGGSY